MAEEVNDIVNKILSTQDVYKKAQYIDFLRNEKNVTLAQISRLIKLKPSYTAHILRLVKLPDIVIDGYYSKLVSATHLFIISRLYTPSKMIEAYEKVLAKSLPVQETEHLIREMLYDIKTDSNMMSKKEVKDFTEALNDLYKGVQFKIIQTRLRGKIICEIKGGAKDTSLVLRKIAKKLTQDDSGVKRIKKDLFVLE